MTHIEQFIKDAQKGGYGKYALNKVWEIENFSTVSIPNHYFLRLHDGSDIHVGAVLLDPLAWQAVGKKRGWRPANCPLRHHPHSFECEKWREKMLNFIQHLQDGKSIEDALAAITPSQDTPKPDTVEGEMENALSQQIYASFLTKETYFPRATPEEYYGAIHAFYFTTLLSERAKADESKKQLVELVGATCTACKNKLQLKHDTKEL